MSEMKLTYIFCNFLVVTGFSRVFFGRFVLDEFCANRPVRRRRLTVTSSSFHLIRGPFRLSCVLRPLCAQTPRVLLSARRGTSE